KEDVLALGSHSLGFTGGFGSGSSAFFLVARRRKMGVHSGRPPIRGFSPTKTDLFLKRDSPRDQPLFGALPVTTMSDSISVIGSSTIFWAEISIPLRRS